MTNVTLGSRGPVTGATDTSTKNPGNWTIAFTPDIINVNVPQFEVYKMIVKGAPNTTFTVYVDNYVWDVGIYGTLNSWDPTQPLILRPGQTLYFAYSDPTTDSNPPVATIWLRYDTAFVSGKPVPS
jgi:hypothetical protein